MEDLVTHTHALVAGKARPDLVNFFTSMMQDYGAHRMSYFSSNLLQACEDAHIYWDDGAKVSMALGHAAPRIAVIGEDNAQRVSIRHETPHWPPWIVSKDATQAVLTGRVGPASTSQWHTRFHVHRQNVRVGLAEGTRRMIDAARAMAIKLYNVYTSAAAAARRDIVKYGADRYRTQYNQFMIALRADAKAAFAWSKLLHHWLVAYDATPWATFTETPVVPWSNDHAHYACVAVSSTQADPTWIARALEDVTLGISDRSNLKDVLLAVRRTDPALMGMWCLLKTATALGDIMRTMTHAIANAFGNALKPRAEHGFLGTHVTPAGKVVLRRLPMAPKGQRASGDRAAYAREAAAAAALIIKMEQDRQCYAIDMRRAGTLEWKERADGTLAAPSPRDIDPAASDQVPEATWTAWTRRYNARRLALVFLHAMSPDGGIAEARWETRRSQSTVYIAPSIAACVEHLTRQIERPDHIIYTFKEFLPDTININTFRQCIWDWAAQRVWRHPCWEGTTWLNVCIFQPLHAVLMTGIESRDASADALRLHQIIERSVSAGGDSDAMDVDEVEQIAQREHARRNAAPPRRKRRPAAATVVTEQQQQERVTLPAMEWVAGMQAIYNEILEARNWPVGRCRFLDWWAQVETEFSAGDRDLILVSVGYAITWCAFAAARAPDTINPLRHVEMISDATAALLFDDSMQETLGVGVLCARETTDRALVNAWTERVTAHLAMVPPFIEPVPPTTPLDSIPLITSLVSANDAYIAPWAEFIKTLPQDVIAPQRTDTVAPGSPASSSSSSSSSQTRQVINLIDDDDDDTSDSDIMMGGNLLEMIMKQGGKKRSASSAAMGMPLAKRRQFAAIETLFASWTDMAGLIASGLSVFATVYFYIMASSSVLDGASALRSGTQFLANVMPDGAAWQLFVNAAKVRGESSYIAGFPTSGTVVEYAQRAPSTFYAWPVDVLNETSQRLGMPSVDTFMSGILTACAVFSTVDAMLCLWYALSRKRHATEYKLLMLADKEAQNNRNPANQAIMNENVMQRLETAERAAQGVAAWRSALVESSYYQYAATACLAIRPVRQLGGRIATLAMYSNSAAMSVFTSQSNVDLKSAGWLHTLMAVGQAASPLLLGGSVAATLRGNTFSRAAAGSVALTSAVGLAVAFASIPTGASQVGILISLFEACLVAVKAYDKMAPPAQAARGQGGQQGGGGAVQRWRLGPLNPDDETTLRGALTLARIIFRVLSGKPSDLDRAL